MTAADKWRCDHCHVVFDGRSDHHHQTTGHADVVPSMTMVAGATVWTTHPDGTVSNNRGGVWFAGYGH